MTNLITWVIIILVFILFEFLAEKNRVLNVITQVIFCICSFLSALIFGVVLYCSIKYGTEHVGMAISLDTLMFASIFMYIYLVRQTRKKMPKKTVDKDGYNIEEDGYKWKFKEDENASNKD